MIWILVAHRADARLFKSNGKLGDIQLIKEFDHPEGRRQNREIDTDAKGSRYSTTAMRGNSPRGNAPSMQHRKHGMDPVVEAVEHISDIFAKELATILRDGRTRNECQEVILVAEPAFLGKLRKFIDKDTGRMVSTTLNRNLSDLPVHEQVRHLDALVHSNRKVA